MYAPSLAYMRIPSLQVRTGPWVRVGNTIVLEGTGSPSWRAQLIETFNYDPEMEYFLGGIVKSVGRAVTKATKTAGRGAGQVARTAGRAARAVGNVPILGDVARARMGAVRLGFGPTAIALDAGLRVARGENPRKALRSAAGSNSMPCEANSSWRRWWPRSFQASAPELPRRSERRMRLLQAGRSPMRWWRLPAARCGGGRGVGRVRHRAEPRQKGKNLAEAALAAARDRLPGGPAARAAFDAAVALAKGKRLQDVAFAAAGRVLTPSPYAADALTFVKRVVNGQNVQHAALSVAGQRAVRQIHNSARLASHEMEFEQFDLEKSFATTKEMVQGIRELADC